VIRNTPPNLHYGPFTRGAKSHVMTPPCGLTLLAPQKYRNLPQMVLKIFFADFYNPPELSETGCQGMELSCFWSTGHLNILFT
jgi:hypothetical protein